MTLTMHATAHLQPTAALIHPTDLYARRRARLAAQLGAGGIAIVPTAPERQRNRDNE